VLLFAQTFVGVKPPTGKLNDCAVTGRDPEMTPMSSPTATKPPRSAVFILRFLRFSKCSQKWLAESGASSVRAGVQRYALYKGIGRIKTGLCGGHSRWTASHFQLCSRQCQAQSRRWRWIRSYVHNENNAHRAAGKNVCIGVAVVFNSLEISH
jgi:hypothetical protein